MYALLERAADQVGNALALGLLLPDPLPQARDGFIRVKRGEQGQRGDEAGVVWLGLGEQVPQPVVHLDPSGLGQRVHGPLRPPAGPLDALLGDEAGIGELLDDVVERAVAEPEGLARVVVDKHPLQFIRMHRPLGQVGQHGQGQQVLHPSLLHPVTLIRND